MRYLALCCDYDGTLATGGRLEAPTARALERVRASGRHVVLVTGREIGDLQSVCSRLDLFEYIVAENGAVLYHPATRIEKTLAARPPEQFVATLRERGVSPLSVGQVIVATWEPHETQVLETIRDLGLELQVIFNKGSVMVLPAGVNKATGLAAALDRLALSEHNAVGVGDAENDHAFLALCECAVAVANALPTLKQAADIITTARNGAGVTELVDALLRDDLGTHASHLIRHDILLGSDSEGREVRIPPYGRNILLVGTSGSGKSALATGLLERLAEQKYTFCVIDPEGDYETFADAVALGAPTHPPTLDEVVELLSKPARNAIIKLLGLPLADRPAFFASLALRLLELRARTGRPHWLVIDEAHHLLPAERASDDLAPPDKLGSVLQITVHPNLLAPKALADVDILIAVGKTPEAAISEYCQVTGLPVPRIEPVQLPPGEALVWDRARGNPFRLRVAPSRTEHRRHTRKYAEGELSPDRSFYFRGPEEKLNLRAHNLIVFTQLADGVDDETWMHHLRRGDYSAWVRDNIKDERLADRIRAIEADESLTPLESRLRIRGAIEEQYTLPASADRADTSRAPRR